MGDCPERGFREQALSVAGWTTARGTGHPQPDPEPPAREKSRGSVYRSMRPLGILSPAGTPRPRRIRSPGGSPTPPLSGASPDGELPHCRSQQCKTNPPPPQPKTPLRFRDHQPKFRDHPQQPAPHQPPSTQQTANRTSTKPLARGDPRVGGSSRYPSRPQTRETPRERPPKHPPSRGSQTKTSFRRFQPPQPEGCETPIRTEARTEGWSLPQTEARFRNLTLSGPKPDQRGPPLAERLPVTGKNLT